MTGMETAAMIPSIMSGSDIRDTPPWARMSAGTRSSAMTATAPASSAIFACSGVTTSMMTPPLSISAMPRFTRAVPVTGVGSDCSDMTTAPRESGLTPIWYAGQDRGSASHFTLGGMRRDARHPLHRGLLGVRRQGRVVDVEEHGFGMTTGEPQHTYQWTPARGPGVADQIGVHLPGQRQPPAGLGHGLDRVRLELRRGQAQGAGEVVLGRRPVVRAGGQHRAGGRLGLGH